jgi:serine phosphatase RsbU (regulator of sigma subunit)
VLIADVAGKGTSAALYMAELKGLMLSLSKICHSPRDLLIQVNSILSHNLDSRSFITSVTEAMNLDQDLFGEDRLRDIVEEHADLPSEQLRERIMREVESFVGEADAHDDMTMILLKIEEPPAL